MYLGVDYYPEHWSVDLIDEDLERIVASGANTIRIGEFAWHMMEHTEGAYDFSYFDAVIEKAKKVKLYVIFGTPTATFPAWLAKKDPSILSETIQGQKRVFGGRRQYCFNSDTYRKYAGRITKELVAHYRKESQIVAWQVDNEFGHEGSDLCFCDQCHEGFQSFLENKYRTIEVLNKGYGTIFWGQSYNNFDEIPIPKETITTHNPSLQLDWARFRSESINGFGLRLVEIIKENRGSHQLVTHNYFGGFFNVHYDQNILSEALDVVSYDNYPVWGGLEAPIRPANIAMTHDYMRGLKGQNFWILEELMGAQGHREIGYLPRPNQGKLWAYQSMAKGCISMLFFRWRTMTRGAEQFCLGILDANNRDNKKLKEVTDFFKDIKQFKAILEAPIESDVAILYDFDNRWSWGGQAQSASFDYTNELLRLYEGFYNYNVQMDVISSLKDFATYKIIVLPVMQIIDETLAKRLEAYAASGGIIVFSYRAGIKNKDNNLYFGECAPCKVKDLCGIEVETYESLGQANTVSVVVEKTLSSIYEASVWRDLIKPLTAKSICKYNDPHFDQYSAVTVNEFGKGKAYYIGCGLETLAMSHLIKHILLKEKITHIESPQGVEVVTRPLGDEAIRFVMNHNDQVIVFEGNQLNPYEVKIERVTRSVL